MVIRLFESYTSEMFEAIGHLFVSTAFMEVTLGTFLDEIASYPEPGDGLVSLFTTRMDAVEKLRNIETAFLVRAPDRHSDAKVLTNRLQRAFEHRNNLAHNMGPQEGEEIVLVPLKLGKDQLVKPIVYSIEQIAEIALGMHDDVISLGKMLIECGLRVPRKLPE